MLGAAGDTIRREGEKRIKGYDAGIALDCLKQRRGGYDVCLCLWNWDRESGDVRIFVTNAYISCANEISLKGTCDYLPELLKISSSIPKQSNDVSKERNNRLRCWRLTRVQSIETCNRCYDQNDGHECRYNRLSRHNLEKYGEPRNIDVIKTAEK